MENQRSLAHIHLLRRSQVAERVESENTWRRVPVVCEGRRLRINLVNLVIVVMLMVEVEGMAQIQMISHSFYIENYMYPRG